MKNTQSSWTGRFISTKGATVSKEPEFTLEEMFSGQIKPQAPVEERLHPVVYFKKCFSLSQKLKKATLQITTQGIYQAYINGKSVTDALFTPDYTDYNDYLMYQTYDVTALLKEGNNILAVEVADGWYAGRISVQGGSAQFGNQLALLLDLTLDYENGESEVIGSDESFTAGHGKHVYADIQIGEKQDLRLDSSWKQDEKDLPEPVFEIEADYKRLAPQYGSQVHRHEHIKAQKIWYEDHYIIVDFGQVIAGRIRLHTFLNRDQEIRIEHAETLDENGKFFRNIVGRNKDATDVFIGRGQEEILEPDFTFHGFRYVKISGLATLNKEGIEAIALYSDFEETGYLKTSSNQVNQLLSNILWSQKGNMLSIPTDCPQRERVGWTGDMQVFAPSSTFFLNTDTFIKRWLKSVRINQLDNGEIRDYSPTPLDGKSSAFTGSNSSAGWGDAIIMVPWTLYERYNDKEALQENYDAMVKWLSFSKQSAAANKEGLKQYLWDTKFYYGDWMFPSFMMGDPNPMKTAQCTKDIVATAFLAHSSELLGKISDILGYESQQYYDYANKVKEAFTTYYLTPAGHLTSDYQGCYVMALAYHMVPENKENALVERLVELIHKNNDCLDTGFVSIPYLLDVLCEHGHKELAKTIFFQDQCPSWFYEINHGATTIWESWAGIQPDGKVGTFSFNHYAFGCVLDWIIRETVGLKTCQPGFKSILIQPTVEIVDTFDCSYKTQYGTISIQKKGQQWHIEVPQDIDYKIDLTQVNGYQI